MTGWWVLVASWFGVLLGSADTDPACLALGGLDLVRAEALAAGEPERLADVYADPVLRRRDEQLLAAWTERGLALQGAGLVRLSCRVVDRDTGRVELEVVDRLGPTAAVGAGQRLDLPVDEPTRRRVTLVEGDDGWRIGRSG